ncbi:cobalamin-5'-phosphate synthase [Raineyella antarctica]|uniref:Adenosylcobinamide-GDP ribazoletransferase n=1 Tax=Raineyella antarctica TaxID=1577474 RepID=A0A1G6GGA6_9ACTN|nr:adenosylcobinamide-GDP ribazoletransferase [Raineyella antarctica]SDB80994.1 cobalamin-5'-phosphate synthase [Raineyella antarctica]
MSAEPGPADGWRLALGTLTRIPAGAIAQVTPAVARTAMLAGSYVVLPVALASAAIGAVAVRLGAPGLVGGLLVVGVLGQLTRAMHWDGLADTADGLGASWDRDRALEVMRTGDVGPMGAGTLVIVFGLQAAAYGDLLARPWGWLLVTALVAASRAALAVACVRGVRAARPEGLGQAVAGSVPVPGAVLTWLLWAGALSAVAVLSGATWWAGALAAFGGVASAGMLLWWCVRRLGGITGDVLGACIEAAATGLAVVAVVAL